MTGFQLPLSFEAISVMTVGEIWESASAELLSKLREDRRIERKPPTIQASFLAEYFSMWSNTPDGGLIVVGVADDGSFLGCVGLGTKRLNNLEIDSRDQCPDARFDYRKIPIKRAADDVDDFVLLYRVQYHPSKVVKTVKGEAFARYGESKRKLRPEEIRELEIDKKQVDIEQELYENCEFPRDFRYSIVKQFVDTFRDRFPPHITDAEILVSRRLGRIVGAKFVPNAACVLLFADDPQLYFPGAKIRIWRFQGEAEGTGTRWNAVKDFILEGPIPSVLEQAEIALDGQLREFSRLGPDNRFYTAPEYPKTAWYEAIVNACAHRSYGPLRNMYVSVKIFDDRLEIESPGAFPFPVTAENIYEVGHTPRNPVLMDALLFLRIVKGAKEGTRRMRQEMQDSSLPPPEFSQRETSHSTVRVTLRNHVKYRQEWVDADVAKVLGADVAQTLDLQERRAVNFIADNGGRANASEIARLLQRDWATAQKMLVKLAGRGILKHVHRTDIPRDPKAHFIIAPKDGA